MKITNKNLGRAIQLANSYGLDKKSMQDRMDWAKGEGSDIAKKVVYKGYDPEEAKDYHQFIVAAHEWLNPGIAGVDLVCHVDGTCNGLQHGAANTGHEATAKATNCRSATREDVPEDLYSEAATTTLNYLLRKSRMTRPTYQMLKLKGRSLMKPPIMRTSYGSSLNTAVLSLIETLSERGQERANNEIEFLKPAVQESLLKHAGAIIEMTEQLKDMLSEGTYEITWVTHDGFKVVQKARTKIKEEKAYLGGGDYTTRIDGVDDDSQSRAIAPNYVHSQDGAMLRETLRTCNFDMVAVHDSYGCRSEDWIKMYHKLRYAFVAIHAHDQGATVTVAGEQHPIRFKKVGNFKASEVLKAPYFFS